MAEVEAVNVMFVWEALRPLAYGQTALVIPDEIILDTTRLATFLAEHRATRILSTPSLLATLLDTAAEVAASSRSGAAPSDVSAALAATHSEWLLYPGRLGTPYNPYRRCSEQEARSVAPIVSPGGSPANMAVQDWWGFEECCSRSAMKRIFRPGAR